MTCKLVLTFAKEYDQALHDWISENTAFPNSMVDRITPKTTDATKKFLGDTFRVHDLYPV